MKKDSKDIKPIKESSMTLIIGFLSIVLAFVLIVDCGYLARTINFIPFYLFGFVALLFYIALILKGVFFIFAGKRFKIQHKLCFYLGVVIFAVGVATLMSLSMNHDGLEIKTLFSGYWAYYLKFYDVVRLPYLFRNETLGIGGGLIGNIFVAGFNSLGISNGLSYFVAIFIMCAGVVVGFIPKIKSVIKNKKESPKIAKVKPVKKIVNKNVEPKKEIKQIEEQPRKVEKPSRENFYVVKDKSKEIIKNASKLSLDDDLTRGRNIENASLGTVSKIVVEEKEEKNEKHITFSEAGYNRVGGLQPVRFIKEGVSFDSHPVDTVSPEDETLQVEEIKLEEKAIAEQHEEVKKPEQMELDFDAPSEPEKPKNIDPTLLTARPEFSEAKVINKQVAADNNNEPVVNLSTINEEEEKPKMVKHKFIEPSLDLLNDYENSDADDKNMQTAEQRKNMINDIFKTFNVHANCIGYKVGPSVTRYNIAYTETAQFKSVNNLTSDISIRLGGVDARFESIVPGETYSGLEISNAVVTTVGFKEVLEKLPSREKHPLAIAFGKNISGEVIYADLDKTPHMLISGTTGSGKSIFIHSIIMTLIMRNNPDDLRLVLVDPKRVEMSKYKNMPHLLCPNITEPEEAVVCLNKLVDEMENRYQQLEDNCVSDIGQYNELCEEKPELEKMPYYVAILDEYSDLVDRAKDIQRPVISLAQKARACGIHLIICTQRPSTNVITGLIKGNLPTHVALMTASTTDSITIIGEGGAEKLLGKGDMLVQSPIVSKLGCCRLQGCFVQNKEIIKVVDFLKSTMTTDYHPDFLDLTDHSNDGPAKMPFDIGNVDIHVKVDDAYEDVKEAIMQEEYASISKIQREFGFGFTRAGRIFQQLVKDGIIEQPNQKKGNSIGCKVLVHDSSYGRQAEIGSDEVATTETMDEYMKNADKADGIY